MNMFIPKHGLEISHTNICSENYGTTKNNRTKSSLSELNTGEVIYLTDTYMDGEKHPHYHVNLIKLLDKVFLLNSLNLLSLRQQRFIELFFKQAGIVDKYIDNNENNPYKDMSLEMKYLDSFLGSYGVNNG